MGKTVSMYQVRKGMAIKMDLGRMKETYIQSYAYEQGGRLIALYEQEGKHFLGCSFLDLGTSVGYPLTEADTAKILPKLSKCKDHFAVRRCLESLFNRAVNYTYQMIEALPPFPEQTDDQFEKTFQFCSELGVTAYIFPIKHLVGCPSNHLIIRDCGDKYIMGQLHEGFYNYVQLSDEVRQEITRMFDLGDSDPATLFDYLLFAYLEATEYQFQFVV